MDAQAAGEEQAVQARQVTGLPTTARIDGTGFFGEVRVTGDLVAGNKVMQDPVRVPGVPGMPGAADTAGARPVHQLPRRPAGFVGRTAELAALDALLPEGDDHSRTAAVVVIHGMPGVGKSDLAVLWAHDVAARFPDGQLYLPLGRHTTGEALTAGEALSRVLQDLGLPARRIPADEDARAALFRSMTARRRMLIVLDNAASPDQVRPLLPGSPCCAVVITSRSTLSGLAARDRVDRVLLGVLPPAAATELLAEVIGAEAVRAEPAAAAELARSCGYLPLALRIAAERVLARGRRRLADAAAQLAAEHDRLSVLATADQDLTVSAVFSWSYRTLPADAARMFRLLGLHAGPDISTAAAAALAGLSTARAHVLLSYLTSVHLLEETELDRYRLHDLLRLYAAERCVAEPPPGSAGSAGPADGTQEARSAVRRVLAWYLHSAYAAYHALVPSAAEIRLGPPPESCRPSSFSSPEQAMDWCERERANLLAATRQAATLADEHATAWKLPAVLARFLVMRKPWTEWVDTQRVVLEAARRGKDRFGEAWTLTLLGIAYRDLHRPDQALDYSMQALAIHRELGYRQGEGLVLGTLALVARDLGRREDALDHGRRALAVHRLAGNQHGEGLALALLGLTLRELGRFDEAITHSRRALGILRRIGDQHEQVRILSNLGASCQGLRRYEDAIGYHRQALAACRIFGDRHGEGIALSNIADAHHGLGRTEPARLAWRDALVILQGLDESWAARVRASLEDLRECSTGPAPGTAADTTPPSNRSDPPSASDRAGRSGDGDRAEHAGETVR